MPAYYFVCRKCGAQEVIRQSIHKAIPSPAICSCGPMTRDYRSEKAGLSGIDTLKKEADKDFNPFDFLPTPKDFLRQAKGNPKKAEQLQTNWNENHEPRGHNSSKFRPGYGQNK